MKIAPGNPGILHSVRFEDADKQFPDDYNDWKPMLHRWIGLSARR
jgi:hypothetical protein